MTGRDELEPYTATLRFEARDRVASCGDLVAALLEDVAEGSAREGSSVIGHIKGHGRAGGRSFSCSLTSRRTGAACRGRHDEALGAGEALDLDLAVLVYGLSSEVIRTQVHRALRISEERHGGRWIERRPHAPHAHEAR